MCCKHSYNGRGATVIEIKLGAIWKHQQAIQNLLGVMTYKSVAHAH